MNYNRVCLEGYLNRNVMMGIVYIWTKSIYQHQKLINVPACARRGVAKLECLLNTGDKIEGLLSWWGKGVLNLFHTICW